MKEYSMKRYVSYFLGAMSVVLPLPLLPKHPMLYGVAIFAAILLIMIGLAFWMGVVRIAKK